MARKLTKRQSLFHRAHFHQDYFKTASPLAEPDFLRGIF
jgi:hypothetical protein